jgi:hypothetical protein
LPAQSFLVSGTAGLLTIFFSLATLTDTHTNTAQAIIYILA